jgi:hypothetical protein
VKPNAYEIRKRIESMGVGAGKITRASGFALLCPAYALLMSVALLGCGTSSDLGTRKLSVAAPAVSEWSTPSWEAVPRPETLEEDLATEVPGVDYSDGVNEREASDISFFFWRRWSHVGGGAMSVQDCRAAWAVWPAAGIVGTITWNPLLIDKQTGRVWWDGRRRTVFRESPDVCAKLLGLRPGDG